MSPPTARYFAHSANDDGRWQELGEHLRNVAESAAVFAEPFGAAELARLAGLWHDLGKFHPDFQRYLQDPEARRGPDHSSAGAVVAADRYGPLAFLVAGHHRGLPDRQALRERMQKKARETAIREAIETAQAALGRLAPDQDLESLLPRWLPQTLHRGDRGGDDNRAFELFLRLLFSCLVDADFLDTEAHFNPVRAQARGGGPNLGELWRRFEAKHRTTREEAADSPVNRVRNEIYEHALAAAERPSGRFRLTVPTGGGKTLSGMAFALRHALENDFERVVVAIPYTSIIEQTADVYREVFGEGVLEHHSAVAPVEPESPVRPGELWPRLAAENWDAPIVVTTTVQLFESLFANRPSRCRKLHNLAGSVVVLDEVQTLPAGLLAPILDGLRELVDHYRVTVVFSTATQPAVAVEPYAAVFDGAEEIVPRPERYFEALQRVRFEVVDGKWSWERAAEEMRRSERCLAVLNTKNDAAALLEALADPAALLLSTNLCGAPRRAVLAQVRHRLAAGEPCRLVSTQVVEAGVDLDFPLVLRALGPLDRIVQAAGRCNREGRQGPGGGRVVVFEPESGGCPPGWYSKGLDTARILLAEGADLGAPDTYRRYFRMLSQVGDLDEKGVQPLRAGLDFSKVGERFRLIDDDTVPAVVAYRPHRDQIDRLVAEVRGRGEAPRIVLRRLQPYLVNLRRKWVERHAQGLVEELAPGLLRWNGDYDEVRGIVHGGWTAEQMIV